MSHTAVRKPLEAVIDQNEGAKQENHKAVSTWERTEFLRGYGSYCGLTHHIATCSAGTHRAHSTIVKGGFILKCLGLFDAFTYRQKLLSIKITVMYQVYNYYNPNVSQI